jgi:hypothetical protein
MIAHFAHMKPNLARMAALAWHFKPMSGTFLALQTLKI